MQALDIVIFGGTGDLSFRKLLPAFYYMSKDQFLPNKIRLILVARRAVDHAILLEKIHAALIKFLSEANFNEEVWQKFKQTICFLQMDITQNQDWTKLSELLNISERQNEILYYLAVPPTIFGTISSQLEKHNLAPERSRIIVEKPLGEDLQTAQEINDVICKTFAEKQIYRIDHYLGKNAVQRILPFRLNNKDVEKFWSADYIDHIQITISEAVGVEGRFEFLDRAGVLRDMVQNHLMQILCMVAMELPNSQNADDIRDQKLRVVEALDEISDHNIIKNVVRGQYTSGKSGGEDVPGYLEEIGEMVPGTGETYVALKTFVQTARWQGMPFYLRTGKRLSSRYVDIIIQFKPLAFDLLNLDEKGCLTFQIQPEETIKPRQYQKSYLGEFLDKGRKQEAYEVLLRDAVQGDQTRFVRGDEIDASWFWIDGIRAAWQKNNVPLTAYKAGSYGPKQAKALLKKNGHVWFECHEE